MMAADPSIEVVDRTKYELLLRANVANFINEELADDVKSLKKAKLAVEKLENMKRVLENQVSVVGDETPQKLGRVLQSADEALNNVQKLSSDRKSVIGDVERHVAKHNHLVEEFVPETNKVVQLDKYLKYMQWIQAVDEISSKIKASLDSNSNAKVTQHFVKLANLCKCVQGSNCKNLVKYITETTLVWHRILKDKFSKEFDDILKGIKWPCIPSIPGYVHAPSFEALSAFEQMFRLLLDIHLPAELLKTPDNVVAAAETYSPLVLPLQLLLRPFKKRFLYHFTGNKKTNNSTRPEWYFTQILTWIRDHIIFVEQYVQPVLIRAGRTHVMAKIEFIKGLVELVIAKLSKDVPAILFDESALAHIINETLFFERELKRNGYPTGQPSCLNVITQDNCFNKWLQMERKLAMDNVDAMLSSITAWKSQYQEQSDIDENKVPECAERFLTMIQSLTDRYKILPMPGHRLQFLEIQLELIDDFRLRLCQLRNEAVEPLTPNFCSILNVVHYLSHVLSDWCDLPFFLQMQYYKLQFMSLQVSLKHQRTTPSLPSPVQNADLANDEAMNSSVSTLSSIHKDALDSVCEDFSESALDSMEGTVFEDIVGLLKGMKDEMIKAVITCVVMEVKAKSLSYRHEKWFIAGSPKDVVTPTVSPSAIGMFMVLSYSLHKLAQILAVPLFNIAWQNVAEQLNDFLYEELVLMNKFSVWGASQLDFDMNRNLFPLFAEYTRKPENFFKEVKESCILLNLKPGSALLLKEAICNAMHPASASDQDPSRTLEEIGVFRLTPKAALDIINRRTDLSI